MDLQAALTLTVVLGIFQFMGGMGFGYGLRLLRGGRDAIFMLIWGAGFGGGALFGSISKLLESNYPLLALIGPALFLGAIPFSILLWPRLWQHPYAKALTLLGIGAFFLFVGLGIGIVAIQLRPEQNCLMLPFAGVFILVGGLQCAVVIRALIRGERIGE